MPDKITQVYNAYKADGATKAQNEQQFRNWMVGENYRRGVYDDLVKQGANVGTFEHFTEALGYRMSPKPRSKAVQQAVAYKAPQVPENFGTLDTTTAGQSWLQRQNSESKPANRINVAKDTPVDVASRVTGKQGKAPRVVKHNKNTFFTQTQLGDSDLALDYGFEGRTQKVEDDKKRAASLLNSLLTKSEFDEIDKLYAQKSGKQFQKGMISGITTDPNDAMGTMLGSMREASQKYGTDAIIAAYNKAIPSILNSDSSRKAILEQSKKLGMDPDVFVQQYMLPGIEKTIHDRLVKQHMPKSDMDYVMRGVLNGVGGNLITRGVMTKTGRDIMNEGHEKYLSNLEERIKDDGVFSKAGAAKYGNIGVGVLADTAAISGAGKIAGGMMSGLGTGVTLLTDTPLGKRLLGGVVTSTSKLVEKYGVEGAARIANFVGNNKTWLGTILTDGAKGTLRSGFTLGNYGAMQYVTGEGYDKVESGDTDNWIGGLLNSYSNEFKTGLKFGVVGAVGSTIGRNVGITGAEASNLQRIKNGIKKASVSTGAFVAESLAFRSDQIAEEWAKDHKINFMDNFIQGACENMAMKLGSGHYKQFSPKNILRSMTMATGDKSLKLTDTEKRIFLENTDARNLVEACEALEPNHKTQGEGLASENTFGMKYEDRVKVVNKKQRDLSVRDAQGNAVGKLQQFLDNKEIPLKLRMKVSAALGGTMGTKIPRASRIVIEQGPNGKNIVKEYAEDGELIDAKEHSTYGGAEEDRQERYLRRQDRDFKDEYLNAMDVTTQEDKMSVMELVAKDNGFDSIEEMIHESALRNSQGDDSLDKKIKADYKKRGEEYAGTKAKRVLDIQRAVSEKYDVDLDKAMDKDFLLRTDKENEAIDEFKNRLRGMNTDKNDEESNKAVARQDGADLSEQTELEDSEKFTESARTVNDRQASATAAWMEMVKNTPELEEWMRSNPDATVEEMRDNFGDDVADAYMELSKAKSMKDGFIQNTSQKIEDAVQNQVTQARFTGTLDGEKSGLIYIYTDKDGNEYTLVGGDLVWDAERGTYKVAENNLAIFRDKDGNIVQKTELGDLIPTGRLSVEDYSNRVRTNLQEKKTAEIQSSETLVPEGTPEGKAEADGAKGEGSPSHEEGSVDKTKDQKIDNPEVNEKYQLSDEVDENGRQFVKNKEGGIEFGEIKKEETGLPSAPILLSEGIITNKATGDGYGLVHIEARHGDQIRKAGYPSVLDFIETVAKNYEVIRKGTVRDGNQTYMLQMKDKHNNTLMVELSGDGTYWNINTAGIFKTSYGKNREEVYNRHTTAKQSVETAGASRETEQGDTQTSPSMNAPTTSLGKDTTKSADSQENNETLTFKDGTEVPMNEKGEPDFSKMTPEQGAALYEENFGADAESTLASERKAAEKALKDANKMKISGSGWSEKVKAKKEKEAAIAAAQVEIDRVDAIQKALTAKKVAETLKSNAKGEESPSHGEANMAGGVAADKFQKASKVVGRKGSRTLADGTKIKGTYMIVPAESLTASHDATNDYKKSEGFPVNAEGRTINDRDYEHDKDAQDVTEQMSAKYDGQAVNQVPTVSDEGIVYDGNGRTMAGQLAAKKGTDKEYIEALKENAEAFGLTAEDVDKIEHPRVIFVPDERLPYNTETFARFNRNEKKSQSNTQEAIANSKKLSPKDVGAIIGEIENSGSLDSFFNNPKAINDLLKTLVEKGIIGQNEVAGLMDGDLMSAKGREFVQNLLLGAVFKEDTLKMMGIEKGLKSKALNAMRQIMDNAKLGEYSLREEIDKAVQLLYEAKRKGYTVDGLLRQPEMFGESASERYPIEVQIMAKALDGKVADFKEIMEVYNRNAEAFNTGEADMFGERPTKEEFINEILKLENWKKYDTRKEKQTEQGGADVRGTKGGEQKARGNNEEGTGGKGGLKLGDPSDAEEGLRANAEAFKADRAKDEKSPSHGEEKPDEGGVKPAEGKKWEDMTPEEKGMEADEHPLTEDEIRNGASEENQELVAAAVAYVNGDKSLLNQIAYLKIYGDVRNRHENVSGNGGTEDGSQLAATGDGSGNGLELESGRGSGGAAEPVDKGAGGETAPGEPNGGENGEGGANPPAGKQGDSQGEGGTPGLGRLPAGGTKPEGSGTAGGEGSVGRGGRRGGSGGPSKSDAKRKPTAKQGTTFPNGKGTDVKKETSDAKAAMKAAFAKFKELNKKDKGKLSSSLLFGLENKIPTAEVLEYLPEVMKATGRYGIAVMREGIYKAKEWFDSVREAISDDMKDCGFSDEDVDAFIREMWHMPWTMDGETHKIGEWSSIYGYSTLRSKLKEPLKKKFDAQVLAEPTEVKVGDKKNIEETLPFLLPQQQDDVLRAETQFFDESHKDKAHAGGKGYMFTNGTGTGKTYTGLGIVKRMVKQGKKRILIITPSQAKVTDWKNDGKNLCLDIRDLDDWAKEHGTTATTEKGEGVVITTFANFRANKSLLEDQFDMVVYDESHRIMENKKGIDTEGSRQHYMLTNRNEDYALMRLEETNEDWQKLKGLAGDFDNARKKKINEIEEQYRKENPSATDRDVRNATQKLIPKDMNSFSVAEKQKFPELGKIYDDYISAKSYYEKNVKPELVEQAKKSVDATKVVFLSATPFNSRENIEYAEGYLFSYPERNAMGQDGKTQFFLEHFGAGYKYRYHRLENSVSNAEALAKQEVEFSDWLQNDLGTMSGRVIDSPYDYSRDFPTVSVEQAQAFNEACEEISRDKLGAVLYQNVLGDYNYGNALFETMKVGALLPRLKAHLDAGRKVVIFHRRVASKQPLKPPFEMMLGEVANRVIKAMPENERAEATKKVQEWRQKYAGLLAWEQTLDYSMPREQLAKAFGKDNVLFFSGNESSKEKNAAIKEFNSDDSGKNIIVIQEASGKEGISLHDTTGKHQRVCITLALPQSPITALQIEGRTYRIGNESNAIFEYPVLGLNSEYNLFASKFNQQVSTTENLALGSQARNLRESFARGIEEHSGYVPIDQQGVGGKDFDRGEVENRDPFDNAVLDYYTNQKINRNNREGADYFPTPEPLGYKMVEWANIGEGDSVLEPSAGHGAIARYVPRSNELVAIEPSMSLFAKLQMKAGGMGRKFQNGTFEDYFVGNKHDTIVMNPPFGHAGTTAIEHLAKAFGHLEEGGRIVAIIPRGATDKKFDKWLENTNKAVLRAEVNLPDIAFQQAGTKVNCRVVVLDRISDPELREKAGYPEKVDLSGHYDKIEDFFNDLRDVEMPDRIIDTNFKMQKLSKSLARNLKDVKGVRSVDINKNEVYVKVARDWRGYGISFSGSDNPQRWREKMGDAYDKYSQMEKTELNGDKQAVFGELKELACKLAGMTEDEMRRYLTSKNSNSNSYNDEGVRYRKGEETGKYAKESRIVPQDVDKEVSSRIEKKFDEEIEKAFPNEKERERAESVIEGFVDDFAYAKTSQIINEINWQKKNEEYERQRGGGTSGRYNYHRMRFKAAMLASEREMEYRRIRANRIKGLFGVEGSGRQISVEGIAKAFEETKGRDSRGRQTLFRAALDLAKRLGTEFYLEEAGDKASHMGVTHTDRKIGFFLDGLTRTATNAEEFNVTIAHELLHQSINGAINLVKKGKAKGFLSDRQIEGVNTILDIYNKVKDDKERFKENAYGLKNEYEFAAQMADPRQRKVLDVDIFGRVVNAARELVKKGDYSLWQRVKDAFGKLFETSDKKKMDKALENIMEDFNEAVHDYSMEDIEQEGFGYKVEDPKEIERLEKEPKIKVYRAMQVIDGRLYPPMAAKVRGGLVEPRELGEWERADENPDLAIPDIDKKTGKQKVDKKTGELKWKFKLDKGGKDAKGKKLGDVPAAYNPYWHTSRSPLNDQFSSAYKRPNLKVVEVEVPESELTSGYKAERAKDAVGEMTWHSGPVSSKLPKEKERKVILSRWDKPVRVLSDAEVADKIAEMLRGEDIEIPDNTITPSLKTELIKRGLKVTETDEVKEWNDSLRFRKGESEDATGGELTPREKEQQEQMEKHRATVLKATEKLNTRTTIHDNVEDIENETVRKAIENGEKVKAWYDVKTGEVHLYLPNVTDKYDAQKSVVHEVVGHKGMRNLLGESGYRDMMRRMYTHLSEEEASEVNERMMKNGWDFYTAMDEWVADKAEESVWTPQEYPKYIGLSNLWSHIKHYVTEAIHKVGYNINPNVDDVKYWLWESKRALQNGDTYTEMKRNSFLWRLNHGTGKETLDDVINSPAYNHGDAQENVRYRKGTSDDAMIEEAKTLFRKGSLDYSKNDTPQETATKDAIEQRLGSWQYRETEAWKDNMASLDTTQKEMSKSIKNFDSSMDVYHGAINQSSVVAEKRANFERRELKDLQQALRKPTKALGGGERGYENVNMYIYMKSGLERNRVLLVRDVANNIDTRIKRFNAELRKNDPNANVITFTGIEQYRDEFHAEKDYLTTLLEQGQIDLHQYYDKLDKFIRDFEFTKTGDNAVDAKIDKLNKWYKDSVADKYDPNGNDYSGISSIVQNRVNGQFSDSAIIDAVMQAENTIGIDDVENLWSAVRGVTGYVLESDHKYGIVSSAAKDRAKGMFNWYIPMRGFKEDSMEDSYAYMHSDSNKLASSSLKTAKGRTTLAQSPLGTAAAMAERAISRGEDNANKQRMYRLANAWLKEHTEEDGNGGMRLTEVPPVMVSDVWYEKKTDSLGNDYWEVATPDIKPDMSAEEIRKEIADFENDMKAKQAKGGATKTLQKGVYAKPFEDPMHKKQNVVTVWFGGKQRQIIFTGNPRAAQALNGELKSDEHGNRLMRFMGSMFTSYNVTFAASNLSRDTLFANNNISIKENAEYYARFTAMQARLLGGQTIGMLTANVHEKVRGEYFNMWAHYKQGKAPKGDLEKLFYEFMDNGGKTGFVKTKTIDNFEDEIRKNAGGRKAMETVGKVLHSLPEVIEGLNERAENLNRFACYATSRKMGRSIMRSITDAKEVSVNFNRRGLGAKAFDVPGATWIEKAFVANAVRWCRGSYMFFNAGMQGLRTLQKNMTKHYIRTTVNMIGIPMVLGGYLIPLLNQVLAGDDGEKYASLPEWERRNNFCFYLGKNKWLKIPLAIELRAFYGLGDVARSVEDKRLQSTNNIWLDAAAQLTQILPVDFMGEGMSPVNAAVPDYAKPVWQVANNEDWTGKPIYKDYDYMKYDPEYLKVYAGEFEPFVNLSKFINEASGGTAVTKGDWDGKWNNPAIWNNIVQGYFGGAGSDATRTAKIVKRLVTGDWDGFSTREVPMVRAMYSTPTEKTVYYRGLSKYAKYKELSDKYDHDMRVWKKNQDNPEISMKYNAELHGNSLDKRINALIKENEKKFKQTRKLINSGKFSDAETKAMQMQIDKAKLDLVNEIDNMK